MSEVARPPDIDDAAFVTEERADENDELIDEEEDADELIVGDKRPAHGRGFALPAAQKRVDKAELQVQSAEVALVKAKSATGYASTAHKRV